MAQVIKFRRRPRRLENKALYRKRLMPRNVFLPILLSIGLLVGVSDFPSVGTTHSEKAKGPSVFQGGDALNGGRRGLGGISTASNDDAGSSSAEGTLVDRVTRVRDGDTIVVGLIPIRIANLDCAERGTAAGDRATRVARRLVSRATLTCRLEGRRSYDREVGICALPDGRDFGEVLISGGVCDGW